MLWHIDGINNCKQQNYESKNNQDKKDFYRR